MRVEKLEKLHKAVTHLENALLRYKNEKDQQDLNFMLLAKTFEVLVEYAWKHLRSIVIDEGLDARSPKEAIRKAAELGLISKVDRWIDCVNARNDSVHDYFAIPNEDYIKLANEFLDLVKKLSQ